MPATERIIAPWTEDQVAALNAYQRSGIMHPFTCGNEDHELHQTLFAESDGWHCPDPECSYTQNWALVYMADREALFLMQRSWSWQAPVHTGPETMAAELKRYKGYLQVSEDQLSEARARIGSLEQQNRALRIVLARVTQAQKAGLSPSVEQTAGDCDAMWVLGDTGGRAIEDHLLPGD